MLKYGKDFVKPDSIKRIPANGFIYKDKKNYSKNITYPEINKSTQQLIIKLIR